MLEVTISEITVQLISRFEQVVKENALLQSENDELRSKCDFRLNELSYYKEEVERLKSQLKEQGN